MPGSSGVNVQQRLTLRCRISKYFNMRTDDTNFHTTFENPWVVATFCATDLLRHRLAPKLHLTSGKNPRKRVLNGTFACPSSLCWFVLPPWFPRTSVLQFTALSPSPRIQKTEQSEGNSRTQDSLVAHEFMNRQSESSRVVSLSCGTIVRKLARTLSVNLIERDSGQHLRETELTHMRETLHVQVVGITENRWFYQWGCHEW